MSLTGLKFNRSALGHALPLIQEPWLYGSEVHRAECGSCLVDVGVHASGGLEAGRVLAEICMAGLGRVGLERQSVPGTETAVTVRTDLPAAACFAGQYAGWQIQGDQFFAMGSGPMRVLARKEPLIDEFGFTDSSDVAVGVLETGRLPGEQVCRDISAACGIDPANLTLLAARTASIAGHVQVVARSVETALHKLHALQFDVTKVKSGYGVAPLPPIAADDVVGIGRTNDAVLYGGIVTLWIDESSKVLRQIGEQLPSSASGAYGRPFEEILRECEFDFYKIDPLLFSPGQANLVSLRDGTTQCFGQLDMDVLARSFGQT